MLRMIALSATCRGERNVAGRPALLIFSDPTLVLDLCVGGICPKASLGR